MNVTMTETQAKTQIQVAWIQQDIRATENEAILAHLASHLTTAEKTLCGQQDCETSMTKGIEKLLHYRSFFCSTQEPDLTSDSPKLFIPLDDEATDEEAS